MIRFWTDVGLILGIRLDVSFADFRTVGVSGAHVDLEVVRRARFGQFLVSFGVHFGSIGWLFESRVAL